MDDKDLQHLANLVLQLHMELGRAQRKLAEVEKERNELKKLTEPKGEEN